MPKASGLSPETSEITGIFGRKKSLLDDLKNAPKVEIGPMTKAYKAETPEEKAKVSEEYAEILRRKENQNDPIKRGLSNLAENAIKLASPSTYVKAAGGSEDMGEVADIAIPGFGELKVAAMGAIGAGDLLKYLGKAPKVTTLSSKSVSNARLAEMEAEAKALKAAEDKYHTTPKPYSQQKGPREINGSRVLGKRQEIADLTEHYHKIDLIDAFFESIKNDRSRKIAQEQRDALARIRTQAKQDIADKEADNFELRPYSPKK